VSSLRATEALFRRVAANVERCEADRLGSDAEEGMDREGGGGRNG
jgi:hypothetical protein